MNLVYVHLNTPIPRHLARNLKRSRTLFPEHAVYLVTNVRQKSLKQMNVNVFYCKEDSNWHSLNDLLQHDKEFRSNFWFTSAARFLAMAQFSREYEEDFLHLESDVIISRDFPFQQLSKSSALIQFPLVSDSLGIASCMYIKNSLVANYLASKTLSEAFVDSKTTDMHVLRIISRDSNSGFKMLPTAPSDRYSIDTVNEYFLNENSQAISYFRGVFDGFNLGRYLFGDDPRNKRGISKLRVSDVSNYLDVRRLKLIMTSAREFPLVYNHESNEYFPIFALHIHSKKLALFSVKRSRKYIKKAVESFESPPKTLFSISIFLKSIRHALIRRFHKFMHSMNR
jgi:hypothetical protein